MEIKIKEKHKASFHLGRSSVTQRSLPLGVKEKESKKEKDWEEGNY